MLAAVSDQFEAVNQRLETQLTRIGQLQQQMDQQQKDIVETRADVTRIRTIIESLVRTPS
jgi:predicted  nucleic acid-binding Zn-ribbon protein